MLKKRIIPCLDIQNGRTVKGVNFVGIRDAGDPITLAKKYVEQGADELVFLDIAATVEGRKTLVRLVQDIAKEINIPFTVGGGIQSVDEVAQIIRAGADKVSINSAAVKRPSFITEIAQEFGSQCVVVAIDTQLEEDIWKVYIHGGRKATNLLTVKWAQQVEALGAGELLLTSMNSDGTKEGFAIAINAAVSKVVNIPVIASGGAGTKLHFKTLFEQTEVSAGLAASIFHYGEIPIPTLKKYLQKEKIPIRCK